MTPPIRVDVAGLAIYVRSDFERGHLEQINNQLARLKMALHQIARKQADQCPGDCMEVAYANLQSIARDAVAQFDAAMKHGEKADG